MRSRLISIVSVLAIAISALGLAAPSQADEIVGDSTTSVQLTDENGELTAEAAAGLQADPPSSSVRRVAPLSTDDTTPDNALVLTTQIETVSEFNVAALTWPADQEFPTEATILIRVRESDVWSEWLTVEPDDSDTEAQDRAGTDPFITGAADAVQVAIQAPENELPSDLRLELIYPTEGNANTASFTTATASAATSIVSTGSSAPTIIRRSEWGVSDETPNWSKRYYTLQAAVIHHTAGTNNYSAAQSKAIVKSIFTYHTQTRGWGDIGYNFLVDKYGQIFEGRAGSVDSPDSQMVEAGHAYGYNKGTLGISALGDYTQVDPTTAIYDAYVSVISWRFGLAGLNASDASGLTAGGYSNSVYASGASLPRIFGHRDVGATSCPGDAIAGQIATIISRVGDWSSSPYFRDVSARTTAFVTEINWMYTSQISMGWFNNGSRVYLPWAATQRDAVAAFLY